MFDRILTPPRSGARPGLRLLLCLGLLLLSAGCDSQPAWNVLLVTFDTTRADHLGCYGHPRASTPTLDRLAAEGVLFRQAFSSLPLTLPSHTTIMTGLFPPAHGVRDNGLFVLSEEQTTLAERLASEGYATGGAIGGFPLVAQFGIGQGFDHFDDHLTGRLEDFRGERVRPKTRIYFDERPAARVNEAIFPWLDENAEKPFFAWVHYYDPHQPQEPPKPYDQLFADDPYLGEIAYADENLGHLLRRLEDRGALDRTIVVFTSDHGEGRGEHRELTHAYLLYNSTLHIPLIVRLPPSHPLRGKAREVEARVTSVDIMPTVLELLGLEIPEGLHGRSMVGLLAGKSHSDRPHYAETLSPRFNNDWGELRALYDGQWKYVHGPKRELFDLEAGDAEKHNLVDERPEVAEQMETKLGTFLRRHGAPASASAVMPDEETRARLEALGYLQGGGGSLEVQEELRHDGIAPQDRIEDVNAISRIRQALFDDQPRTAAEIAQGLVDEDPGNRYYLELLAQAYAQLGKIEEMLQVVDRMLELNASSGTAERLLLYAGQAIYFGGDKVEGLRRVEQSLERKPTADGHYTASILWSAEKEAEKSLASLKRALELDPSHAKARDDLAARLAEMGDRQAAASEFKRLLADHPYYPKAHYNFGVFVAEDDLDAAARSFRRALELDPDYLEPYFGLALVELRAGRPELAREALDRLEAKAPGHPTTRRTRAMVENAS